MKKIIFLTLFTFNCLTANNSDPLNLLEDLYEATKISTKTKLNVNKTPSIVSVLHSDELQQLGAKSIFDSLSFIPGVQTTIGNAGRKKINMRGNDSLLKDKLKLLIDGVNINNELTGGSSHIFLDMPLEMIERIEIIRGPAATIYGSQAHVGVINIITKSSIQKKNAYFIKRSSKNKETIGFTQSIELNNVQISMDGYFKTNEALRATGPYRYKQTPLLGGNISTMNGTSYEDYENHSLGAKITLYDDWTFLFRFTEHETQNFYGYGDWPITHDPRLLQTTTNFGEVRYAPSLSRNLSLDLRAGYREFIFEGQARIKPYATTTAPIAQYDLIGDGFVREGAMYSDSVLKYTVDKHDMLFGLYLSETQQIQMDYYFNNPGYLPSPPYPTASNNTTIANPGIEKDISRYQYALYFNDIYNISENFVANIGLRYDDYNDADSNIAHKLALLYNQNEEETYKLMYQRSFRVPSWLELYGKSLPYLGDPSLKPEIIDTIEFAYNHQKKLDKYLNINVFYTQMKDYISDNASYTFVNGGTIKSHGVEVDLKTPLTSFATLQANYSYVNMKDAQKNSVPFVANNLANLMLINTIGRSWSFGSTLSYIGEKRHQSDDSRGAIADYMIFNQAITYKHNGFSLQLSVDNLFDQGLVDPSPKGNETNVLPNLPADVSDPSTGTYLNDYRRDGRTFWISAKWEFE